MRLSSGTVLRRAADRRAASSDGDVDQYPPPPDPPPPPPVDINSTTAIAASKTTATITTSRVFGFFVRSDMTRILSSTGLTLLFWNRTGWRTGGGPCNPALRRGPERVAATAADPGYLKPKRWPGRASVHERCDVGWDDRQGTSRGTGSARLESDCPLLCRRWCWQRVAIPARSRGDRPAFGKMTAGQRWPTSGRATLALSTSGA